LIEVCIVAFVKEVQPENALSGTKFNTVAGITMFFSPVQPFIIPELIFVTVDGTVNPETVDLFANAFAPTILTGKVLIVGGIFTTPPVPTYPVNVMAPIVVFVVYVKSLAGL